MYQLPCFINKILIAFLGIFFCLAEGGNFPQDNNKQDLSVIYDSRLTLSEALKGIEIPDNIRNNLVIIDVHYFSFDNKLHLGQLVIHKNLSKDIQEIFNIIKAEKFPVAKVIPVVKYNWSDSASMNDNNTSAFNYRRVKGSNKLSAHAKGKAIDINPLFNPFVKNKYVSPEGAVYDTSRPGTIAKESFLVKEFLKRGWKWGGNWKTVKDYQHFEKNE